MDVYLTGLKVDGPTLIPRIAGALSAAVLVLIWRRCQRGRLKQNTLEWLDALGIPDHVKVLDFGLVKELSVNASTPELSTVGFPAHRHAAVPRAVGGGGLRTTSARAARSAPQRLGRELPPALEAIVTGCLAKQHEDLPATVSELGRALGACDVAPWTEADGARWWTERGPAVQALEGARRHNKDGSLPSKRTIAVELAGRAPASS